MYMEKSELPAAAAGSSFILLSDLHGGAHMATVVANACMRKSLCTLKFCSDIVACGGSAIMEQSRELNAWREKQKLTEAARGEE